MRKRKRRTKNHFMLPRPMLKASAKHAGYRRVSACRQVADHRGMRKIQVVTCKNCLKVLKHFQEFGGKLVIMEAS